MSKTNYPLILVFYLERNLMTNKDVILPFTESVNHAISTREANAIAFFIPTEGEPRIECINPIVMEGADMEKVNKLVEDIAKNFDIGQGADEGKNDEDNIVEIDKEGE